MSVTCLLFCCIVNQDYLIYISSIKSDERDNFVWIVWLTTVTFHNMDTKILFVVVLHLTLGIFDG